jgi:hypothetical protein
MTQSALEQLKAYKNYHISKEVWYNKFPYRLSLLGHWTKEKLLDELGLNHSNVYKIHSVVKKFLKNKTVPIEYRVRSGEYAFCVYLKTAEDVITVMNIIDPVFLLEVQGPVSEKQESIMLNDINVLIKDSLYYKKYRYKIDVIRYRTHAEFLAELKDFVVSNFELDTYKLSQGFKDYEVFHSNNKPASVSIFGSMYTGPWRYHGSVYLKNYEDLCTLHMMYKNEINKTTKIVTTSEV